jgi:hypothetical protein
MYSELLSLSPKKEIRPNTYSESGRRKGKVLGVCNRRHTRYWLILKEAARLAVPSTVACPCRRSGQRPGLKPPGLMSLTKRMKSRGDANRWQRQMTGALMNPSIIITFLPAWPRWQEASNLRALLPA